ncbi:MAG: recombinase family protein [Sulfurimonas sp.]|nr:recombinase family protein [Sulfurimonas sp.]
MVISYIRVSSNQQTIQHQQDEINRYCSLNNLEIDKTIEIEISSRKDTRTRKIDELLELLSKDDLLIVTELSRLGRNTGEVINLIDTLIKMGVEVRILKQNLILKETDPMNKMMITILSMFAEFERDIISQRTKEALKGLKDKGVKLGKPKNTIQKSIFDKDQEKIVELLGLGLSYKKVVTKHLGYGSASTLHTYVKKRDLLVA